MTETNLRASAEPSKNSFSDLYNKNRHQLLSHSFFELPYVNSVQSHAKERGGRSNTKNKTGNTNSALVGVSSSALVVNWIWTSSDSPLAQLRADKPRLRCRRRRRRWRSFFAAQVRDRAVFRGLRLLGCHPMLSADCCSTAELCFSGLKANADQDDKEEPVAAKCHWSCL